VEARQQKASHKTDQPKRDPFFDAYFEGFTQEQLNPDEIDWTVFMASTYILELDASKDFARMAQVLPDDEPTSRNLKKGLLSIAADETNHAAYLYEAMTRCLPYAEIQSMIDVWRTRKVNALMASVKNFLQQQGKIPSLVQEGVPAAVLSEPVEAQPSRVRELETLASRN
jgi:hypothetical protein